jgi:uncharacterized protein YbcC (UPF0753/DUF2309 family)
MRTFIHHNPLHSLEDLPFEQAVQEGKRLFHGRVFLRRPDYQHYLEQGKVDSQDLAAQVAAYVSKREPIPGIDLQQWLQALLTQTEQKVVIRRNIASTEDVQRVINNQDLKQETFSPDSLLPYLRHELLEDRPVYDAADALYGTEIGTELDELVIKSCLDFFDEGQSVWSMPGRRRGFFQAWRKVANRNIRLYLRGMHIKDILAVDDTPEGVIAHVMNTLGIPEERWVHYFTRELAQLHGWSGFIRWRWNAKNYYWSKRYPADLIDLVAIRLTFALALLSERQDEWGYKDIATSLEKQSKAKPWKHICAMSYMANVFCLLWRNEWNKPWHAVMPRKSIKHLMNMLRTNASMKQGHRQTGCTCWLKALISLMPCDRYRLTNLVICWVVY